MATNHPGVREEPAAARPSGTVFSVRARVAIFLVGAALTVASVLLAASSLQVLERGGEIDDEDAMLSPIEWHDVGQPSAG